MKQLAQIMREHAEEERIKRIKARLERKYKHRPKRKKPPAPGWENWAERALSGEQIGYQRPLPVPFHLHTQSYWYGNTQPVSHLFIHIHTPEKGWIVRCIPRDEWYRWKARGFTVRDY